MNKYGVLTTGEELANSGAEMYETIKEPGTYRLRLDFRTWYNRGYSPALVAHFSDGEGNKYRLFAFRHVVDGQEIYNPKKSKLDFEKVVDGTSWDCVVDNNKKGKAEWMDAIPVVQGKIIVVVALGVDGAPRAFFI